MYKFKSCECEFLNETTLWAGRGPHGHEGQKIKGVAENKPLPANNKDTKVVAEKCIHYSGNRNSLLKRAQNSGYKL